MKKDSSLALLALAVGFSQTAFAQTVAVNECCWIDAKTGKQVRTAPISGANLGAATLEGGGTAQMEGYDPKANRAYNPKTGQNYAKEPNGCWIDTKTGKQVRSVPISGANLGAATLEGGGTAQMEGYDPKANRAYNPKTGRNFARVPCPPPATSTTVKPPTEHVLKTQADLFEFGFGYNYINAPDETVKNLHGFNASIFVNVNSWLSLGGEFEAGFGSTSQSFGMAQSAHAEAVAASSPAFETDLNRYVYVFGPRVTLHPTARFSVFAEGLLGGVHDDTDVSFGSFQQQHLGRCFCLHAGWRRGLAAQLPLAVANRRSRLSGHKFRPQLAG